MSKNCCKFLQFSNKTSLKLDLDTKIDLDRYKEFCAEILSVSPDPGSPEIAGKKEETGNDYWG